MIAFERTSVANNTASQQFDFTETEWSGIVDSGNAAAALSFSANFIVVILHVLMTWWRPAIVNRLSLRMIVLSCIFNIFYCACQLITDTISSTSYTCRVLAYILIASDTMACMCLAMVGLNLVMIFVLKVSRSLKLELLYYLFIILSGVLVVIVPYRWGENKGPKNENTDSCWFHYYFNGRMNNIFNWMWYYGWLLFSLVFAALCAAISIRFVLRKQENFAETIDMYSRQNKPEAATLSTLKRYANNNTDVFQKIARRCIFYPLIPFFSKSWGVGIEIAASQKAFIPYPIFVLDRIFSCLLGFMVSCLYFTDPAIGAVFQESKESLKQKYVYDYYCVKYQPGTDPSIQPKSQYPQVVRVVANMPKVFTMQHYTDESEEAAAGDMDSLDISLHPHRSSPPYLPSHKPDVPTMEVHKKYHSHPSKAAGQSPSTRQLDHRRYSVISVTSANGKVFLPNEVIPNNDAIDTGGELFCRHKTRNRIITIPMRRVNQHDLKKYPATVIQDHSHGLYTKHTDVVETLVPFKWRRLAKLAHWMLVSIFKVSPLERVDSDAYFDAGLIDGLLSKRRHGGDGKFFGVGGSSNGEKVVPTRIFRDYTDSSTPATPAILPIIGTTPSSIGTQSPIIGGGGDGTRDPSVAVSFEDVSSEGDLSKQVVSSIYPPVVAATNSQSSSLKISHSPKSTTRCIDTETTPTGSFINTAAEEGTTVSSGKKNNAMRKVSTINVASVQRSHVHPGTPPSRPVGYLEPRPSISASDHHKLSTTLGLAKMWRRKGSIQFNWSKLGVSKGGGGSNDNSLSGTLASSSPNPTSKKRKTPALSATLVSASPLRRESTSVLRREFADTIKDQQAQSEKRAAAAAALTGRSDGSSGGSGLFTKRAVELPIDINAFKDDEDDDAGVASQVTQKQEASNQQEKRVEEPSAVPSGLALLSHFPVELSPRPISQYRKHTLKKPIRQEDSSQVSSSVPIRRSRRSDSSEKRFSHFAGGGDDVAVKSPSITKAKDPLTSFVQLFDSERRRLTDESSSSDDIRPKADNLSQPTYASLTPPTEQITRPISLVSELSKFSSYSSTEEHGGATYPVAKSEEHQGFTEGFTSIDYISSWQVDPTQDDTRITVFSEPWDIDQQLKLQIEMAENIAHM